MIVFYGMQGSGTDKKVGGGFVPNVEISAFSLWNGKKFRNWKPPQHEQCFLDSGGYAFFKRAGDYPFKVQPYVALAANINATFVAVRDYPCEPDVFRDHRLLTNKQRITATIENTLECLDIKEVPWVAVVQGYHLSEYQYSCDLLKSNGIATPLMAIGSLCVRKNVADVRRIIRVVKSNFPDARLHGFGIDMRFIKDSYIRTNLWSSDTQAWQFNTKNVVDKPGYFLPSCEAVTLQNFEHYQAKINTILKREQNTPMLEKYA